MAPVISIVQETPEYIVINKPAGIPVHGDGRRDRYTVADWVVENFPEIVGVGEHARIDVGGTSVEISRPGIVHRLDADTSGVMVIARTEEYFQYLKKQFSDRLVMKSYTAIVHGTFRNDRGTINAPIGDARGVVQIRAVGARARGELREAITTFRVIHSARDQFDRPLSVIECVPKTGRTHQIRVHMQSDGHPIVSDPLYCPRGLLSLDHQLLPRLALHATRITFRDIGGVSRTFGAEIPQDMRTVIESLEKQ